MEIWSATAEADLADAYQFNGSTVSIRSLALGRDSARFRVVRLEALRDVADVHEAGDVFMYRDSSIAPSLDLRRRIKAVKDVLDSGTVSRAYSSVGCNS